MRPANPGKVPSRKVPQPPPAATRTGTLFAWFHHQPTPNPRFLVAMPPTARVEGAAVARTRTFPRQGGCGIAVPGLRQLSPAPRGWRRAFAGSRTRPAQACRSPHAGRDSARAVLSRDPAARGRARRVNRRGRSQTPEIRYRRKRKIGKEEMEDQRWEMEFTESWRHGTR